ncbi:hypothetical protein CAPTEDRAFT_170995 [Capitella teleta]|uniref:protein disulfide-isomerase n=1 Tax=Capitella teleta TaxID=283909 RepID=R7TUV8_CAPTE|nr:hypothetical protein CAPTEDRAFT_170995 [Capitella teleta]|eukprot:ELT97494.1 hypothetical protein CAPTEDRAFT_170995 [Capitella teleta]
MTSTPQFVLTALLAVLVTGLDVQELTSSDFYSTLAKYDLAMVQFTSPVCSYCKTIAQGYAFAAEILKNDDPPILLAKIDCSTESNICMEFDAVLYPEFKIFRSGELAGKFELEDDSTDAIMDFMRSKAGPSSKPLLTKDDVELYMMQNEIVVLGFFDAERSNLLKQFKQLADDLRDDYRFAHSIDSNLNAQFSYSEDVVIVRPAKMDNKFEESTVKYDGAASLSDMKIWLKDNVHGLAGQYTHSNMGQFNDPLVVVYYNVDYAKNEKGTNYWRDQVLSVAKNFVGKDVYFAIASAYEFENELYEFGLWDTWESDPVVAIRDASYKKFVMTGDFSTNALEKFTNDFLAGNVEPYLKSEPIPSSQDKDVKVVVAKNFDDIVNDATKDVMIEFYAPWARECKTFAPKYDEIAARLTSYGDIVIAKMDATVNDVPHRYTIRRFPTLFFSPKGFKDSPLRYVGSLEVNDVIDFINENASR